MRRANALRAAALAVPLLSVLVAAVAVPTAFGADIHIAAAEGDVARVDAILNDDASQLDARNEVNETPIHAAAREGRVEVVRLLLDRGLPVDIGDNENSTALDVAAIYNRPEVARLLVEQGANTSHRDDNGLTPLMFALYNRNFDIGRFLIERGADVNAVTNRGSTPLHSSTFAGDAAFTTLLLERGASVHVRNEAGFTPLLSAAAGQGDLEVLELLISAGADVHDRTLNGDTALMFAARAGRTDVMARLIDAGLSVGARNDFAWTALMSATENGGEEAVALLLERGADPNTADANGHGALWWAAARGNLGAARLLLDAGADVSRADPPEGFSSLMRAFDTGNHELVELLLENGADVNATETGGGRTVLHGAALKGWPDVAELFLSYGADHSVADNDGMTPLHYAARYGHRDVADLLKAHGARAEDLVENYGRCPLLNRETGDGQAAMWYLGHCGWAVRTAEHFLVFDYWKGSGDDPANSCITNGHIDPDEIRGENVYVFVTHDHGDHYDTVINEWADELDNITYVFGFRPEATEYYRESGYDGPAYEYVGPRDYAEVGDVRVRTIEANDAGVGFLVEVDGLKLYHAGDHAGWADDRRDGFFSEIDYIAPYADGLDMAFVNVTGCHAHDPERLREGNLYTIEKLKPGLLVPTHAVGREYVYREVATDYAAAGVTTPVCCPSNRGDGYFYNGSGIE